MTLMRVMFVQESWWDTLNALARSTDIQIAMHKPDKGSSLPIFSSKIVKRCEEMHTLIDQIE